MASRPLDLTPKTHIIEAQRERDFSYPQCFSELIDNSLDAGATAIEIVKEKDIIRITDNGCGCDDIERMLRMGEHVSHSSTTSGRYGVGLKDSSQWAADLLRIRTTTADKTSIAQIDWKGLIASGDWAGYAASDDSPNTRDPTGTEIVLKRLRKQPNMPAVERALAYTFAPAIRNGRRITINGVSIHPYQNPKMSEQIAFEFTVRGLLVKGVAGVVVEGEKNPKFGFNLVNHHRTITNTTVPADGYSTSNFFSVVELVGHWPLSRNKESVSDDDLFSDLCDALADHCTDILVRAERQSHSVALSRLRADVNELAVNLFGGESSRPRAPKSPESESRATQPGPRLLNPQSESSRGTKGHRPSGLQIDFAGLDSDIFAQTDVDARRVVLNTDNEGARSLMNEGGLAVLRAAVQEFVAQSSLVSHRQLKMFGESAQERYQNALGRWMAEIYRRHAERSGTKVA